MYYQYYPNCLSACPLTILALLHVDGMEAAGPVWTYWAFPTERFCGRLYLTQPRARQYPYFRRKSCNTKLAVYGLNLFLLPCYSVDLEPYLHWQHLCFCHLICLCHVVHIIAHAPSVSPESSLQGQLVLLTNLLGWKQLGRYGHTGHSQQNSFVVNFILLNHEPVSILILDENHVTPN